jgi:hypothetical protein
MSRMLCEHMHFGYRLNLLLLLTALLTSLTGMISGDRAGGIRAPAAAVAAERAVEIAQAATTSAAKTAHISRPAAPLPTLRDTNVPLTRALALVPALRITAEKRRE